MAEPENDSISEEEYSRWYTPKRAVEFVATHTDWNTAHRAILKRAESGKIRVHAEDIRWERASRTGIYRKFSPVPDAILKAWAEQDHHSYLLFWSNGDGEIDLKSNPHALTISWKLFGIRFDPTGLAQLAGIDAPTPLVTTKLEEPQKLPVVDVGLEMEEPPQKGPPPSPKALAAWYEAYKLAYPNTADTEAKALESARGCFPDKTVSRESVRALRGAQKRGPKSGPAK